MKRLLSYAVCIIALGTGSISSTALAQTTAPGPYYATPSWNQTSVAFPNNALPPGHPFNVRPSFYWSATTFASNVADVWGVDLPDEGNAFPVDKAGTNITGNNAWCVRGGQGPDLQ